jgi:undecaprenyl-diphosphatase
MTDRKRRRRRRGLVHGATRRVLDRAIRIAVSLTANLYAALGLVIIVGALIAFAATWAFVEIAVAVQAGGAVQQFDDAVMLWLADHRMPLLEAFLIELTVLGSWVVIAVVISVAALFLETAHRRWSVIMLFLSSLGGIVITQLLKMGFDRERPQAFEWADHVVTSSFPSGHAVSAAITYGTIAYLAARLHRHAVTRWVILVTATLIIVLASASRVYLGVHYPTDVIAGLLIGFAWAAFCMTTLEATQRYARSMAPDIAETDPYGRREPEAPARVADTR